MAAWMENTFYPYAFYQSLIVVRLITLNKQPMERPVVMGDVILRIIVNFVLEVAGYEATHACGKSQLFRGLTEGIEGGIHGMPLVCMQHSLE